MKNFQRFLKLTRNLLNVDLQVKLILFHYYKNKKKDEIEPSYSIKILLPPIKLLACYFLRLWKRFGTSTLRGRYKQIYPTSDMNLIFGLHQDNSTQSQVSTNFVFFFDRKSYAILFP